MLELKDVYSGEIENLRASVAIQGPFSVFVDFYIGDIGGESSDIYKIAFLSEDKFIEFREVLKGHKCIILPVLNWGIIEVIIDNIIKVANMDAYPQLTLRKMLDWEYENYIDE